MVKICIAGFQFFCHFISTTYITNNDSKSNLLSYFCTTLQILCRYIKKKMQLCAWKLQYPLLARGGLSYLFILWILSQFIKQKLCKDTKILFLDSSLSTIHPLWHCTDNQHMNDKHFLLRRFLSLTLLMLSSYGEMFSPGYHVKLKQVHLPRRKRILYNKLFYSAVAH